MFGDTGDEVAEAVLAAHATGRTDDNDPIADDNVHFIAYGKVLIFCPNFLHGNVVNEEPTTRWSMNCRFTGLFTPYDSAEKSLGSFYLPITVKPVTRVGMAFRQPGGFQE